MKTVIVKKEPVVAGWLMTMLTLIASTSGLSVQEPQTRLILEKEFPSRRRVAVPEPNFKGKDQLDFKHGREDGLVRLAEKYGVTNPTWKPKRTNRGHAEDDIARSAANASLIKPGVTILDVGSNAERNANQGWTNVDTIINGCCDEDCDRASRWTARGYNFKLADIFEVENWYDKVIGVDSIYYWNPQDFVFALIIGGGTLEVVEQDFDLTKKIMERKDSKGTTTTMVTEQVIYNNREFLVSHAQGNSSVYAQPPPLFGTKATISIYDRKRNTTFFVHRRFVTEYGASRVYSYSLYVQSGDHSGKAMMAAEWEDYVLSSKDKKLDLLGDVPLVNLKKSDPVDIIVSTIDFDNQTSCFIRTDNIMRIDKEEWVEFLGIVVPNVHHLATGAVKKAVEDLADRLGDPNSKVLMMKYYGTLSNAKTSWISRLLGTLNTTQEAKARLDLKEKITTGSVVYTINGWKPKWFTRLFVRSYHSLLQGIKYASLIAVPLAVGLTFLGFQAARLRKMVVLLPVYISIIIYTMYVSTPLNLGALFKNLFIGESRDLATWDFLSAIYDVALATCQAVVLPLGYTITAYYVGALAVSLVITAVITRFYLSIIEKHVAIDALRKNTTTLSGAKALSNNVSTSLALLSQYSPYWLEFFCTETNEKIYNKSLLTQSRAKTRPPDLSYQSVTGCLEKNTA